MKGFCAVADDVEHRTSPPNARIVKPSYKTGTISRSAARAAVKALLKETAYTVESLPDDTQ
jgi:hypothetical protein